MNQKSKSFYYAFIILLCLSYVKSTQSIQYKLMKAKQTQEGSNKTKTGKNFEVNLTFMHWPYRELFSF